MTKSGIICFGANNKSLTGVKIVMKKERDNSERNGSELPRAKDFKLPKRLTKDQKELLEAFREAMKALKEEEAKYGKKDYSLV